MKPIQNPRTPHYWGVSHYAHAKNFRDPPFTTSTPSPGSFACAYIGFRTLTRTAIAEGQT